LWLSREEGRDCPPERGLSVGFWIALLPTVAGLFLVDGDPSRYTGLMRWASWWVVPVVVAVLVSRWRLRGGVGGPFVGLSLLLLLLGLAVGIVVREQTLLVPAHYHGAVAAVTLGYMGVARRLLI
ncbi:MAG: hypothetical protein HQM00_12230, partial [Magnetococcales bacterium]|nr:hypothetical protein [Magnetococcales bacterium]